MRNIQEKFKKANLDIEVTNKPLPFTQDKEVFQMTIENTGGSRPKEYFKMFQGNKSNIVEVLSSDPKKRQIVLMVKEPEREFTTTERNSETKEIEEVKHKTIADMRKYLVGHDERQLFISQLDETNITTVAQAHEKLKPNALHKKNVKRQGEWFFKEVSLETKEEIYKRKSLIKKKVAIEITRGKPHIVDERISYIVMGSTAIFIRGKVRHPDHKTIRFNDWVRVYKNTERRDTIGVHNWID